MAHEITIREDGSAEAAFSLKKAWHGLGTVVDSVMNVEDAIRKAQMDWEVEQMPVYGHGFTDDDRPLRIEMPGMVMNVRKDTGLPLGIVTKQYALVQNTEAFAFVDALRDEQGIEIESAGSLKGGKIIWILARMPEEFEVVDGDKLEQFILFTSAHDGTKAVRVMPTSVRVVCNNTLTLATAKEDRCLSIRHKGNIMSKLDEARKVLTTVNGRFDEFNQDAKQLQKVHFDIEKLRAYTMLLIPDEVGVNNTRRRRARASIISAYTDGPQNMPGVRGTAWAAFNAVTQHFDHAASFKGKNTANRQENRMQSLLFASAAKAKTSALNLLKQTVLV